MKKICFIASNRVHLARQQILLKELKKYFEVDVFEPKDDKGSMAISSILYAIEFNNYLAGKEYDFILARGDRYEILPMVMVAVYKGIKIIHIEGGDLSGVIDNKVRHALTQLSDYHFCTNEESRIRLINMGVPFNKIWDFGSLDVELASKVKPKKLREREYILVAYHCIPEEDPEELNKALGYFKNYDIIRIGGNKDYGKEYGNEQYSPEDYINLMRGAKVCVGNSSSLIKEASILKVPVVLIGERQKNRLLPHNVLKVPCKAEKIKLGIIFQSQNKYKKDLTYYKPKTSKKIADQIKKCSKQG